MKMRKIASAVALALGVIAAPYASAVIELNENGRGDVLLFPVVNGYVDNYLVIMNTDPASWYQGHIRFRGAAYSTEHRDLDLILSPGDVAVIRFADITGDGRPDIDQSLDPDNFKYTGMSSSCDNGRVANCMELSDYLMQEAYKNMTQSDIDHDKIVHYVEFIGEGQLVGMSHGIMNRLTDPNFAGQRASEGQREVGNKLGTHLWSWVDADNVANNGGDTTRYHSVQLAADVPNVLGGTGFVKIPGRGTGVAYNAEAFANFRTANNPHRIDNYIDTAVILHDENGSLNPIPDRSGSVAGVSPRGDYVYGFPWVNSGVSCAGRACDDRADEARISFNNTWGPTLADGDDYGVAALRGLAAGTVNDDWDSDLGGGLPADVSDLARPSYINSVAEVEEAIRAIGQNFVSFYTDNSDVMKGPASSSFYFAFFPTKFYYGEDASYWNCTQSVQHYNKCAGDVLMTHRVKPVAVGIWDINERSPVIAAPSVECVTSPCPPPSSPVVKGSALKHELAFFGVDFFKYPYAGTNALDAGDYTKGMVTLSPAANSNTTVGLSKARPVFPMLSYTFEYAYGDNTLGQWRSMLHE